MENASKALMMAAGILIGILILSLGVYLFNVLEEYVDSSHVGLAQKALIQFNEQYLEYHGLDNLTIQDIITVKNKALKNNRGYSGYTETAGLANGTNDFVDVYMGTRWVLDETDEDLLKEELENNTNSRYTCTVYISQYTGRVHKIVFIKN